MINRLFLMLMLLQCLQLFSQKDERKISNCKIKYETDTTNLSKTGILNLKITNLGLKSLKISNEFSDVRIQPLNIEKFDLALNLFVKIPKEITDVNCIDCFGKFINLKSGKSLAYSLDLNALYFVKKIATESKTEYQFNLWFDTNDILKFSRKTKCFMKDFTSEKILFRTK